MEIIPLSDAWSQDIAEKAAHIIQRGGVVLYPTDTLYGLGADALSDEAVAKIYAIKGRDEGKPMHAIVADIEMAEKYGLVNDQVRLLEQRLPKGKVTFVTRARNEESGITRGGTFGFRIPDNEFCIQMVRAAGVPIVATSANRAGAEPQHAVPSILEQLSESREQIDLAVDAGESPIGLPSTVVDLTGEHPVILREAAVSAADVWAALSFEE